MNDKYEKLNKYIYIGISYYKCTDIQLIENVEINDSLLTSENHTEHVFSN